MSVPVRKHPRLKEYDYSQVGAYHINIHALFDAPPICKIKESPQNSECAEYPRVSLLYPGGLETELTDFGKECYGVMLEMQRKYPFFEIYTFVFMPTHIHLLLRIDRSIGISISDYVRELKSKVTVQYNRKWNTPGRKLFQSSFYEHIIRRESDFALTAEYIDNNPKRKQIQ